MAARDGIFYSDLAARDGIFYSDLAARDGIFYSDLAARDVILYFDLAARDVILYSDLTEPGWHAVVLIWPAAFGIGIGIRFGVTVAERVLRFVFRNLVK